MSKSQWLKDENQTGNFSNQKQDTFDPGKGYTGIRLQKGVPLLDRDWNELEDIRRYAEVMLRKHYIGNGVPDENSFKIETSDPPANDFKIHGGRCLVDGFEVENGVDFILYSQQEEVKTLNVPSSDRTDTVYLDVWVEEVTSTQDEALKNANDVRMETCIRHKIRWLVKVAEGGQRVSEEPSHHYYNIASIHRKEGKNTIEAADIVDLRSTGLELLLIKKTLDGLTNLSNADINHKHSRLTGPNGTPDHALVVDQSGNIGIGTTNPETRLHVKQSSDSAAGGLQLERASERTWVRMNLQPGFDGLGQDPLMFSHSAGAVGPIFAVTREGNAYIPGYLGIRRQNPDFTLDVNGSARVRNDSVSNYTTLRVQGPDFAHGLEIDFFGGSGYGGAYSATHGGAAIVNVNPKPLVLGTDNKNRIHIDGNGNVGIGGMSPNHKLRVWGSVYVRNHGIMGSDYSEYFESGVGKTIPLGTAVVIENGKVRQANQNEIPMGVISANPGILGGMYMEWPKKYLRDEFGNEITEEYKEEIMKPQKKKAKKERQKMKKKIVKEEVTRTEIVQIKGKYCQKEITETIEREIEEQVFKEVDLYDAAGKNKIGKHRIPVMETYEEEIDVLDDNGRPVMVGTGKFETKTRPKLNPDYDETKEYIPREKRPEWNCVGLLGQLPLRKGQPVAPSWIKLKDISKDVELWLVI